MLVCAVIPMVCTFGGCFLLWTNPFGQPVFFGASFCWTDSRAATSDLSLIYALPNLHPCHHLGVWSAHLKSVSFEGQWSFNLIRSLSRLSSFWMLDIRTCVVHWPCWQHLCVTIHITLIISYTKYTNSWPLSVNGA